MENLKNELMHVVTIVTEYNDTYEWLVPLGMLEQAYQIAEISFSVKSFIITNNINK